MYAKTRFVSNYINFLLSRFMQGQIKNLTHQSQGRKGYFRSLYIPTPHEILAKSMDESERMNMVALEKINVWQGKGWCALFPALTSTVVLMLPDSAARAVCILPFLKRAAFQVNKGKPRKYTSACPFFPSPAPLEEFWLKKQACIPFLSVLH